MKNLPLYRYYLEILAVPVFAFLVIHLSGHALMLVADPEHDHGSHANHAEEIHEDEHGDDQHDDDHEEKEHEIEEDHHDEEDEHNEYQEAAAGGHDDHGHGEGLSLTYLLSTEVLGGVLALILFAWLWHLPALKKLVPCSHDHCHHKTVWPHVAATVAFAFHWFPEAQVRYELLHDFSSVNWLDIVAVIGFASHFIVDAIILVLLVSFWPQMWQKLGLGFVLAAVWAASFWVGHNGGLHIEGAAEPLVLLVSAFLLAMFVHKPHKPEPACTSCKS